VCMLGCVAVCCCILKCVAVGYRAETVQALSYACGGVSVRV